MQKGFSYPDVCSMTLAEFDEWVSLILPETGKTVHNTRQIEIDDDE